MRLPSATHPVLLCRTEAQAREALRRVGIILSRLKLTLHPTKTQVVYVGDGRQGFDFLGAEAVNLGETGRRQDYCAGGTSGGLLIQAGPGKGGGRGS